MVRTFPLLIPSLIAALLMDGAARADTGPAISWEASVDACVPADLVLDDAGRAYVACRDARARVIRVVAYGDAGDVLAETTLAADDALSPIPVDLAWASGQLYVAATVHRAARSDATVYALATPTLAERWRATQPSAAALSLTTTGAGGVWLGATASLTTTDIVLASYDAAGALAARLRYDSGYNDTLGGAKRSIAADSDGNLYIAATTALLRVDRDGSLAWRVEQPSYAVTVDDQDRVLVTTPLAPSGQTARFLPDSRRDFHVAQGGFEVAAAPDGHIWVGGTHVTDDARNWDLLTTLLDARGRVVFTDRYNGGHQDRFVDLELGPDGDAYVLASSYVRSGIFGVRDSYLLLKYTATDRRVWSEGYGATGLPEALGVSDDSRIVATGYAGTVSFIEEEVRSCPLWWPGCWFAR